MVTVTFPPTEMPPVAVKASLETAPPFNSAVVTFTLPVTEPEFKIRVDALTAPVPTVPPFTVTTRPAAVTPYTDTPVLISTFSAVLVRIPLIEPEFNVEEATLTVPTTELSPSNVKRSAVTLMVTLLWSSRTRSLFFVKLTRPVTVE